MSEVKNCLTCKYEPEWKLDPESSNKTRFGDCRFPFPKAMVPYPFMFILETWIDKGQYDNCPAHHPKE